uniref:Putative secreted protein n=1 Tax=Anopheles marajoara TaxID=58244 RepID=A0A2M4C8F5_9DIPT
MSYPFLAPFALLAIVRSQVTPAQPPPGAARGITRAVLESLDYTDTDLDSKTACRAGQLLRLPPRLPPPLNRRSMNCVALDVDVAVAAVAAVAAAAAVVGIEP